MSITRLKLPALQNGVVTQLGAGSLLSVGKTIYVSSTTGSNDNLGTNPDLPRASISGAQSVATAAKGDVVVFLPGHTETLTASVTLSKSGVSYLGIGSGTLRPSITGNGTIDALSISGASVTISNFQFPAPGTDDQTADINVAAAGVSILNTYHIGSTTSKNKTDIITVASGADDLYIDGFSAYNTVVDVVSAISLEAAVARPVLRNLTIMGTFSTACIMDEATATLVLLEYSLLKNTKTTGTTFNWTNNSTGVTRFVHSSGRNTTLASNYVLGTGMDFFEHRMVEEAIVNGGIFPVADSD